MPAMRLRVSDVAVIIPAHNEETALPKCLRALKKVVPASQIFIGSDGSRDSTVEIGRSMGCNVLDIQPNRGKARAIQSVLDFYGIAELFKVVLIQDADSEIDPDYLFNGLKLFDDPRVVVVAGHVRSRWPKGGLRPSTIFAAYRTRLYLLVQAAYKYAQTWGWINVAYIAPGFCSMYRTSVLPKIDITAPGLVIEDFNMTFEVQRKRLGRIAYSPRVSCSTEDPITFRDYRKQCLRWYTGLWQTLRRHGVWPSRFWLAFGAMILEVVSFGFVNVAVLVLLVVKLGEWVGLVPPDTADILGADPLLLLGVFLALDYVLTLLAVIAERRPALAIYGLSFPFLRLLDIWLFCLAAYKAVTIKSDGRWVSPTRGNDDTPQRPDPGRHAMTGNSSP